jgi:hypothetical protein
MKARTVAKAKLKLFIHIDSMFPFVLSFPDAKFVKSTKHNEVEITDEGSVGLTDKRLIDREIYFRRGEV